MRARFPSRSPVVAVGHRVERRPYAERMSRHILTAVAWPYANGPRHIGHVSGFGVPSDVFSRYMRMAGQRRADGLRHRRARHADPGAGRRGGRVAARSSPTATTGSSSRTCTASGCPTTCSPAPRRATTTRSSQELFRRCTTTATSCRGRRMGAISPSTGRTLPDRYIEGTCPICGYDGARGDQCDNCGNQLDPIDLIEPAQPDQRRDAEVRRDRALLPRPAGARRARSAAGSTARTRLAPERPEVLAQPARRPAAAGDDPRHRLGHPGAAGRLGGPRRQAPLRLVRRGHRLPVGVGRVGPAHRGPRRVARVVEGPGRRVATTSWARTTSSSTPRSGRAILLGYDGKGDRGGDAGRARRARTCRPRWSPASSSRWRASKFSSSRGVSSTCATSSPATSRTRCATSSPSPGRRTQDTDFTWAEFVRRTNDELVAGLGQPGQPHGLDGCTRTSARSPSPASSPTPTARCCETSRAGVRHRRRRCSPSPAEGRDRRGDAGRRRGQQVPLRPGAVEAEAEDPDRLDTVLHVALQAVQRLQHAAHAVPAAHARSRCTRRSAARGVWSGSREIREVEDSDGGAGLPGHHGRLRRRQPRAGSRRPIVRRHAAVGADADLHQARRLRRRRGARAARGGGRRVDRPPDRLPPARCPSPVVDNHCHLDIVAGPRRRADRSTTRWPAPRPSA